MNRREFFKFLGLTAAGLALPGAALQAIVTVAGETRKAVASSLSACAMFQGLPVLRSDGTPFPEDEAVTGTVTMTGSIRVGENDVAAWVVA